MNKYIIMGIAALVFLGLGSYLIHSFGNSKYDSGYNKAKSENSESFIKVVLTDKAELENIRNEVKTMSEIDIDNTLRDLGIMRDNPDY